MVATICMLNGRFVLSSMLPAIKKTTSLSNVTGTLLLQLTVDGKPWPLDASGKPILKT